jgi:regulator of protease activity HflC (stomatin/prohibitin superfamily)
VNKLTGIIIGAVAVLALLIGIPSSATYVNPGHVGIVIHRAGGGVDSTPVGPGIHLVNPLLTGIEEYPTYMQTLVLTKGSNEGSANNDEINVNSIEGQPISLDVSLAFELDATKAPKLYQTFRTDLDVIAHNYVKQSVRQALQEVVGQEEVAGVIGPKKAEVVGRTQALISERLAQYGIVVKQFTVNEVRAPEGVIAAINAKNVMTQEALTAQNELQKKKFLADGEVIAAQGSANALVAEATGKAKANELLQSSITQGLLELKRLEIQRALADKWDGALPSTMIPGASTPLLQLPNSSSQKGGN